MQTETKTQRWHSKRAVANRFGVSTRSIERRKESGLFPPGVQINKRWYWSDAELERYECGLVGGGEAA